MAVPTPDNALLVDIGTSFLKMTTSAQPSDATRSRLDDLVVVDTADGHREWDAERLIQRVFHTIQTALRRHPRIDRIYLSAHMRGFAIEHGDGPLAYIPWQDARSLCVRDDGRNTVEHLRQSLPVDQLWQTGTVLRAQMPLAGAAHWVTVEGGPRSGRFHTLGSLLLSRLVGRHITHESMAAATGFYSVTTGQWLTDVIATAGCQGLDFPEVATGVGPVGEFIAPSGVGVAVFADIGDSQAAAFGADLDLRRAALISLGTAGLVAVSTDQFARTAETECRPFFGRYLRVASGLPGGAAVGSELERGTTRALSEMLGAYRDAVDVLLGSDYDAPILLSGGVAISTPQLARVFSDALARPVTAAGSQDDSLRGLGRLSAAAMV